LNDEIKRKKSTHKKNIKKKIQHAQAMKLKKIKITDTIIKLKTN